MLEVHNRPKRIRAARIARMEVALLIASPLGGCATLMQAFSAVQPTAALTDPVSNAGSFGDASADSTASAVNGQWTTRVYHGWAGPSSQM